MTNSHLLDALDDVRGMAPYDLAVLADCGVPDHSTSPGAAFLLVVARDTLDMIDQNILEDDDNHLTVAEAVRNLAYGDDVHGIADMAPSVYTHRRWQEFVDLQAYDEDAGDYCPGTDDLTATAGVCLYVIADRLVRAIIERVADEVERDDIDDEPLTFPPA